ncbi:MAG: hypothetical protein ACHQ51_02620 [Elusimicrobiota bacterium]
MRRMLLLYTLLIVAPLHGAELVRPQAPVQLSFSFVSPAPVMPLTALMPAAPIALPTVAVLPTAAPVLAVPVPVLPPAAVAPQPASVSPAAEENERTDGRSQLQSLSRSANGDGHAFDSPKRKTKMDYAEFGRQLAAAPGLDMNAFRHTDAKRRILAASGYTHLYGAGGVRIPLSQAADVRVGNAFLSVKKTFDRRPR